MKKVFEIKARVLVNATLYVAAEDEKAARQKCNHGEAARVDWEEDTVRLNRVESVEEV